MHLALDYCRPPARVPLACRGPTLLASRQGRARRWPRRRTVTRPGAEGGEEQGSGWAAAPPLSPPPAPGACEAPGVQEAPAGKPGSNGGPPAAQAALAAQPARALPQADVDKEIFSIALPTLATLAADPIAGLVSTAWVGRLGAPELAAVGVALSVFNTITKLLNMPILSVTTSSVASALGEANDPHSSHVGTAVSAAILLALLTGVVEAALLGLFGVAGLGLWGAGPASPLHRNAVDYLCVRALSAPATVLFLTLQGAFRGLGDTRAPLYATVLCNVANVLLEPLLIFTLGWGVRGAALAIAVAQVLSCGVLLALLSKRCKLRLAGSQALQNALPYLKPTGLLTLRTMSISSTFALATGLAARTGPTHAAAHQVCNQVWLASSLMADSLAVAAQALLARTLAAGDKQTGKVVVERTMQLALGLGLGLALVLGVTSGQWQRLFTQDPAVLQAMALIAPAVCASQPLNTLAFTIDGILYGVGGFSYAAKAMVFAVLPPLAIMLVGSSVTATWGPSAQLYVVWAGLASLMVMRFATIYTPYVWRWGPFAKLAE